MIVTLALEVVMFGHYRAEAGTTTCLIFEQVFNKYSDSCDRFIDSNGKQVSHEVINMIASPNRI